jgi:hypothetical protein
MRHRCSDVCPCRKDLDAAALDLARATRLLSDSIMSNSDDLIEICYARVRGAAAKVQGARAAWHDHLSEVA